MDVLYLMRYSTVEVPTCNCEASYVNAEDLIKRGRYSEASLMLEEALDDGCGCAWNAKLLELADFLSRY